MINKEKVLKGLACCSRLCSWACQKCPYAEENCDNIPPVCTGKLANDALMLLKENNECKNCHFTKLFENTPTCNTCSIRTICKYVPAWGEQVRYNCPHYKGE